MRTLPLSLFISIPQQVKFLFALIVGLLFPFETFLGYSFALLTENSILWLLSSQVTIAHDVQTTNVAMVFSQQMIDQTFGSGSINVLHDVRSGEVGERLPRPQGLPRLARQTVDPPLTVAANGSMVSATHICVLALCSHMLWKRDRYFEN